MGVSDPVVHLFTQHSLTAYLIHNQYLLDVRHCAEQVRLYSALRSLYFLFPLPLPLAGSSSSSRSCLRDRILGRTAPSSHVQEALQADSALAIPFWRLSLSGFRLEYKLHGGRCPDCLARCYFRGSHCARQGVLTGGWGGRVLAVTLQNGKLRSLHSSGQEAPYHWLFNQEQWAPWLRTHRGAIWEARLSIHRERGQSHGEPDTQKGWLSQYIVSKI